MALACAQVALNANQLRSRGGDKGEKMLEVCIWCVNSVVQWWGRIQGVGQCVYQVTIQKVLYDLGEEKRGN